MSLQSTTRLATSLRATLLAAASCTALLACGGSSSEAGPSDAAPGPIALDGSAAHDAATGADQDADAGEQAVGDDDSEDAGTDAPANACGLNGYCPDAGLCTPDPACEFSGQVTNGPDPICPGLCFANVGACSSAACAADSYCYPTYGGGAICLKRGALGQPCVNLDIDVNSCQDGSFCDSGVEYGDAAEGVCTAQSTTTCEGAASRFVCTGGNACPGDGASTCAPPSAKGGGCDQDWDCAANLACVNGTCAARLATGQACVGGGAVCGLGDICQYPTLVAGTCDSWVNCPSFENAACCADDAGVGYCVANQAQSACTQPTGICQPPWQNTISGQTDGG